MRFPRWLVSSILAFQFLISTLQLLDVHRVWYFPMIHGLAYSLRFDLGFSLVPVILPVSAVVAIYLLKGGKYREVLIATFLSCCIYVFLGMEAAVSWFSVYQVPLALVCLVDVRDFLYSLLVFLTGFEVTALVHWMLLPLGIFTPLAWFADLELALFYVLAPLAPLVVLSIFFVVFIKLIFPQYLVSVERFLKDCKFLKDGSMDVNMNLDPRVFLVLSLILSVVGALYPYSRHINPDGIAFGVDVHYYVDWMGPVEQDLRSAFSVANGSRPVILLLIYGFQHAFGLKLLDAIKYLPVLINPLLVLSVYFMVSQCTEDREWAGLASLFSASGFTITVGTYSYFLTNILGLIFIFSALGFIFKTLRTRQKIYFASASVIGSLSVFTHPWTFAQYYAATALFLFYIYFREKRSSESLIVLAYLVLTGLIDVLKGVIGGLGAYGAITSTVPKLVWIGEFWGNNIFAFRQMYGGLLSNTVLLGFAVFGVYLLSRRRSYHLFLMLLLLVSLMFYLMVNGGAQTKLLFNIPFSVLASLGVLFLVRGVALDRRKKMLVLLFTCNYMMVYLLRSLANLV